MDHLTGGGRSNAGEGVVGGAAEGEEEEEDDAKKGHGQEKEAGRSGIVDIHDDDDVGDERIDPAMLRELLVERPDLAQLLYDQAEEAGLLNDDDADMSTDMGVLSLKQLNSAQDEEDDFGQEAAEEEADE